ncbi:MAG: OmpA family protein [Flavobacteriales bacterium]
MKKTLILSLLVCSSSIALAQSGGLPTNPKEGKCYVRCVTPDEYTTEDVKVMIRPSYKTIVTYPAEYKTVTEQVVVREEYTLLSVVPATFEYVNKEYISKDPSTKLTHHKAKFNKSYENIQIAPPKARWEMGEKLPDCTSADPNDCRVWCYKPQPAEFKKVEVCTLDSDAYIETTPGGVEEKRAIRTKVLKTPATTKEKVVPAEYATVTKQVLVKDAWSEEKEFPAEYTVMKKETIFKKGGQITWEEVDCELTEYNLLPINYDLGSANLLFSSMKTIDELLYPVLIKNPNVRVEIASHTDSRGKNSSNQLLSNRRAKSVVDYLVAKGINPNRLIAKGYGETRLKNKCADGVQCSEREHRQNRRTEFRIINQ